MTTWNRRRVKDCVPVLRTAIGPAKLGGGLHLHSLDDTIRAQDLSTAVLLAQGKLATMGEFPDTGETQGKFEGPELARFQWATAVTERILDALGGGKPVTVRHLEVT